MILNKDLTRFCDPRLRAAINLLHEHSANIVLVIRVDRGRVNVSVPIGVKTGKDTDYTKAKNIINTIRAKVGNRWPARVVYTLPNLEINDAQPEALPKETPKRKKRRKKKTEDEKNETATT